MTNEKFLINLKTCTKEFVIIGIVLLVLFSFACYKFSDTDNYNVDELINTYQEENGIKFYPYRINLIKKEIQEKKPKKRGAMAIIKRLSDELKNSD